MGVSMLFARRSRRLLLTLATAASLLIMPGVRRPGVQAAGVPGSWKVVAGPANPAPYSAALTSVAAVSPTDVWTVGYDISGHWDGASWTVAPPARPGNPADLRSVAAVSNVDLWAVGRRQDTVSPHYNRTLVEHWNGTAWSVVSSPNGGTTNAELLGVAVVSANDVWAVGDYSASGPMYQRTLIEHWDGATWTVVPSPNVKNSSQNVLTGVAAVGPNDIWAVGYSLTSNYRTLIEHWNGSSWSIVSSPNVGVYGNGLTAVVAVSANNVWAVGSANNTTTTLALRWNGSTWKVVTSPSVANWTNNLTGIAAAASDDIWAVGTISSTYYTGDGDPHTSTLTLIEHWDGSGWSIVPGPNPGGPDPYDGTTLNQLSGVAVASSSDVWAVGQYVLTDNANLTPKTLTEHYTVP